MGLAAVYRFTHRGTSYSQSFAQTLVLMGMVTALIMSIIGSNIARAFSLVGALSVIRFRNALKETRDVGFMFLAMAVGMACGTRFYMLAIASGATLAAVLVLMFKLDLFAKTWWSGSCACGSRWGATQNDAGARLSPVLDR